MEIVLVDAGPLVALIDRSDPYHERCKKALTTIEHPMATVWPAFTEAMDLLRASPEAQGALWQIIDTGAVKLLELGSGDVPRMRDLMWKYRDLPMDLADAAMVCVAEREQIRKLFTVDRGGFQIYRPQRLGRFEIIP